MFENFCNGKNKPAPMSYFDPMGPGTGITRAGMAIRNAIIKLKFLYEDYNPIGRSSSGGLANALIGSDIGKSKVESDKRAQNGNIAGQYLHLVKRGAKGDEPTMAKSRLKRAIRLKSSNLMKLSKLGFGTAMRRDSRLNHVQKLIWDVAEHTTISKKDDSVPHENENTTTIDRFDTTMEKKSTEDLLIITPSAPPSRLNRRLQQSRKSRPGRRLQSKKNKEAFSGYVNIWRSEPHKVRMLLGDPKKNA